MDAAALYAGTVLLRKTFEALAQRSVTSLFSRLHSRFRDLHQIEILQKELESRLQVLSLPVDMCVQYVLHGNTVLQGALDMVLRVINDIVSFQEELEAQAYNETIIKISQSDAEARLRGFLTRLDAILPYMAMAMNAVSLLKSADNGVSPARLMEASHLIRSAGSGEAVVTKMIGKLHKYETRLALPHWQEKMPLCTVILKQVITVPDETTDFVLKIDAEEQDEPEALSQLSIPLASVASVGFSTLHVLGLGEHELEAVLLIDVCSPTTHSSLDHGLQETPQTPVQDSSGKTSHYALQCVEASTDVESDEVTDSDSQSSESLSSEDAVGGRTAKLGVLAYVLRLCMLQVREEKYHWLVSDERIRMFFADPRFNTEPVKNVSKPQKATNSDSAQSRPTQKKLTPLSGTVSRTSTGIRLSSRKGSVTEMFYDLSLDTAGKP